MAPAESALLKAIEMEEEGKEFYRKSAAVVKSILAKKIFEELAVQEDYHIAMIKKIYRQVKENKSMDRQITAIKSHEGLENIFRESLVEKAKASDNDLEALRFGLEREERSITYYETLAGEAATNFEKRFYLSLSFEERGHFLRIMDAIEYLTDPVGWLYVSERDMVDGG